MSNRQAFGIGVLVGAILLAMMFCAPLARIQAQDKPAIEQMHGTSWTVPGPKLVSISRCPVCGWKHENYTGGLVFYDQSTSGFAIRDEAGKTTVHCPRCYVRWIRAHVPELKTYEVK